MRNPLIALVLLLGCAFVLYQFVPDPDADPAVVTNERTVAPAQSESPKKSALQATGPRVIAPVQFAQPFAEQANNLERIAPRQPLTPPKPVDTSPRPTLLHRPTVVAAGMVSYKQGSLTFEDIDPVKPEEICNGPSGVPWPCGIIARTAFRNFLRGRALSCVVPQGHWENVIVANCLVGKQDPAAWLVSHGWSRASKNSTYGPMHTKARDQSKGVYGGDPRQPLDLIDSQIEPSAGLDGEDGVVSPETDSPIAPL